MPNEQLIVIIALCVVIVVLCALLILKKRKPVRSEAPQPNAPPAPSDALRDDTTEELFPEKEELPKADFAILRDITLIGAESIIPWDGSFE